MIGDAGRSPSMPKAAATGVDSALTKTAFEPGRFANVITRARRFHHAAQLVSELTKSSFVLELAPEGTASLCRGWRFRSFNDGPEVHSEDHLSRQSGHSGRWSEEDGRIVVKLESDDQVCACIGGPSPTFHEWRLNCVAYRSADERLSGALLLACAAEQADLDLAEPHMIDGFLVEPGILLAQGNGLQFTCESTTAVDAQFLRCKVELRTSPVIQNEWDLP